MKTMTCKQLGGSCDLEFKTETFEEMEKLSMKHGMEMFAKNDEGHLAAMGKIKEMMKDPAVMKEWMENRRKDFDALPEDN